MEKVSTPFTFLIRYFALFVFILINVFAIPVFLSNGMEKNAFFAIEGSTLLCLLPMFLYYKKLWNVYVDPEKITAERGSRKIIFSIDEIETIELIPSYFRGSHYTLFKIIKLKSGNSGIVSIWYSPDKNNLDNKLLVEPWQKLRREKAQASLKKRKARF
ncbi:hypothetical protein BH09BAC5_BH09BAC5_15950 [soil metagenome]